MNGNQRSDDENSLYDDLSRLGRKILSVANLIQKSSINEKAQNGVDIPLHGLGEMLEDYSEDLEHLASEVEQHFLSALKRDKRRSNRRFTKKRERFHTLTSTNGVPQN